MVNFTGTFVQYTMEANTVSTSTIVSYTHPPIDVEVDSRVNYVNVSNRPVSGQIYPR